jgi:hypothetical protein
MGSHIVFPGTMNYQNLADGMWYVGHVITAVSIVVNHYSFPAAVVVVFVGQTITMISRPIGRIRSVFDRTPEVECTAIPVRDRTSETRESPFV